MAEDQAVKVVAEALDVLWQDEEGSGVYGVEPDEQELVATVAIAALRTAISEGRVSPEELGMRRQNGHLHRDGPCNWTCGRLYVPKRRVTDGEVAE